MLSGLFGLCSNRKRNTAKKCGISAVYLHELRSIATAYGLQYKGLMYITYITQHIEVDVKYKARNGKVSSGTSRRRKLGTQIGRTLHIDLAECMGGTGKEARESSPSQYTPAFNGYSLALSH